MRARLRTVLIVSTAALAALAAGAWVLRNGTEPARAAAVPPVVPGPPGGGPPAHRETSEPALASKTARQSPAVRKKRKRTRYRVVGSGKCRASYYWEGQTTASGERFDPGALTAAHRTLPMNSKVKVTNLNNGKSVVVRINDRGPFVGGRCLDLSRAAMASIGGTRAGVVPVEYQVLAKA
ncbi:septal ring lytic transglycosylase RlpA family protein [Thermomonospora curvata]|uniref:Probable endolytic peptidoglycan transglycosylase RlpA n=1 Tax=Thermomonospora curvata (strain ATCC 19995 / DSM 43183 / JCM 3096 / KCTC 9072 / NBRC 15933 / NCIMB 10081 / Henssen B9) TaxID=471852 RepID=D1A780_THECD|nr:septal ring lytic transglycosylase RlpA family protein [Thermomonospora curvata]ACZ00286.1 rare lipoprotein A [Thermomonospora curvata DSM 43183]